MGMYDTIKIKLHCVWCGNQSEDWQTKDLTKMLDIFSFEELKKMKEDQPELFKKNFPVADKNGYVNVLEICEKCKKPTDIRLYLKKGQSEP